MNGFPKNGIKENTLKVLSKNDVETIHEHSLKILSSCGVLVEDAEVLDLLKKRGAIVENGSKIVRIPADLVETAVQSAPPVVSLYDRNGNISMEIGGDRVYARIPGGATMYSDPVTGIRRRPTTEDVADIIRVADSLSGISGVSVFPTVPADVPIEHVDVYSFYTAIRNTTKPLFYVCHNENLVDDVLQMALAVAGNKDRLQKTPFLTVLVEASPPLRFISHQISVLKKFAAWGLPVMLHSHNIAGLSCPVTLASEVLLTNAEMLALTVVSQLLCPGLPVIRGMSSSVPNMQNAINLSGAIEIGLLATALSQLSEYYDIPCSMSSGTDSKLPDAQASIERLLTALPAFFSMTDLVNITTTSTKMCFSLQQLVIDNEIMEMLGRFLRGIKVNSETLAVDDIIRIGPGGDYLDLMAEHTVKYYRQELQQSKLFDRNTYEAWEKAGSLDLQERARMEVLRILKEHQVEDLPKEIKNQLESIIAKRNESSMIH